MELTRNLKASVKIDLNNKRNKNFGTEFIEHQLDQDAPGLM